MPATAVAITGISIASAFGQSLGELSEAILTGRSALTLSHRFQPWIAAPLAELPLDLWDITPEQRLQSDLIMRRVLGSSIDHIDRQTRVFARYKAEDISLFLGTTTSGVSGFAEALARHRSLALPLEKVLTPEMQQALIAAEIRQAFPIAGPCFTFSSSCAAAAQAIAQAYDAVRSGICKVAIAGGIDILNRVTLHGFDALQILDQGFCVPFTPERKGTNLAEGGALFLLEANPKGPIQAWIEGYAAVTEAHHMVQPAPEGVWMRATMESALKKADWRPSDIDYINVHGTGTIPNDAAESQAILDVFGTLAKVHVTKSLTGHMLGAAGALEAAITIGMLQRFPEWAKIRGLQFPAPGDVRGLSNSFGFGGSNVSLLISRLLHE